jgi:hypothetical protein
MKFFLSKRILSILLVILLAIVLIDSYLIIDLSNSINQSIRDSSFDFIIFTENSVYKAKNQINGRVEHESNDIGLLINLLFAKGNQIYVEKGEYELLSNIIINNKNDVCLTSNRAKIIGNGNKIILTGDDYTKSQHNQFVGFEIINATFRLENSFKTTISDMIFKNCDSAIEIINTNKWSEGNKIIDIHFINCSKSIIFKTPVNNATGSYASSEIKGCFFNIPDNSVGIEIEKLAEFSDSQIQKSRFWMGEYGQSNQIGILVDGSMFQTLLWGVVFESFASKPLDLYGISIKNNTNPAPIISDGVSFLGNWTAKIHNPYNIWISGSGGIFKEEKISLEIGLNNNYGEIVDFHIRPLTITSFNAKLQVTGPFENNEIVTIRIKLTYIDKTNSPISLVKTFTNSTNLWLTKDDMLNLLPSQNIIWSIQMEAKSNLATTRNSVLISLFGTTS